MSMYVAQLRSMWNHRSAALITGSDRIHVSSNLQLRPSTAQWRRIRFFLLRDALQCKARSCYRMSVRPSVCVSVCLWRWWIM